MWNFSTAVPANSEQWQQGSYIAGVVTLSNLIISHFLPKGTQSDLQVGSPLLHFSFTTNSLVRQVRLRGRVSDWPEISKLWWHSRDLNLVLPGLKIL